MSDYEKSNRDKNWMERAKVLGKVGVLVRESYREWSLPIVHVILGSNCFCLYYWDDGNRRLLNVFKKLKWMLLQSVGVGELAERKRKMKSREILYCYGSSFN